MDTPKTPQATRQANRGVSVWAVQCDKCFKWRKIPSQEGFEEIRSKFKEEPFFCSQRGDVSCDDPGDMEYDSTRTWVADKPNLPKTPAGFKRELVMRKDYSKIDVYYTTPAGKRLRTLNEVESFLKANPQIKGVSGKDFSFTSPKVMEDTVPAHAKRKSVSGVLS